METGYTPQEIIEFLANLYPLTVGQLCDMLPRQGMSLTISQTKTGQRLKVIKASPSSFSVYVNYAQVQL